MWREEKAYCKKLVFLGLGLFEGLHWQRFLGCCVKASLRLGGLLNAWMYFAII